MAKYPKRRINRIAILIASLLGCVVSGTALAQYQLPPHVPGTICAAPQGWCWLPRAGYVGSPCACPVGNGQWVSGVTS